MKSKEQHALASPISPKVASDVSVLRADEAICDPAMLAAYEIECDLEPAREVLMLVSRVFAYGDSKQRNSLYDAMSLIAPAIASTVSTDDECVPALLPSLETALPVGKSAMQRLGLSSSDVVSAWAQRPPLVKAVFPLEMMTTVLPGVAWPYLAAFISGGPAEAEKRLAEAIRQRTRDLTAAGLRKRVVATWLVMRLISELRAEIAASNERRRRAGQNELELSEGLARWTWLPVAPSKRGLVRMGASTTKRDTSAVPLKAIRQALLELAREAKWGSWEAKQWPVGICWRPLKRLATLALLVSVAPRIEQLNLLNVDDLAWHRFADGSEGWGIRFRGEDMKMRDAGNVYWKKLPLELGNIIHAWIICSGRNIGQTDAPLLTTRRVTSAGDPGLRYTTGGLSIFISGNPPSRNTGYAYGNRPLIPLPDQEWKGYQSHRYRSFVTQHVESLAYAWKAENIGHHLSGVETKAFAELLLDHGTGDMGYRDYGVALRYEQIVALGVELLWDSVWGDGAKRRGVDLDRLRDARDNMQLLQTEVAAVQRDLEQTEYRKAELKKKKARLLEKLRHTGKAEREDLRLDIDVLQDRIDDLSDTIAITLRTQVQLTTDLADARNECDEATSAMVVLPDGLPDDDYERELADLLSEIRGNPRCGADDALLADELTPDDVADLLEVHSQTIWRWRTGRGKLPTPAPFKSEAWVKLDEKDFRLPVEAINLAAVPAADPEARLDSIRRRRAVLGFDKRNPVRETRESTSLTERTKFVTGVATTNEPTAAEMTEADVDAPDSQPAGPRTGRQVGVRTEIHLIIAADPNRTWTNADLLSALAPLRPADALNRLQAAVYSAVATLQAKGHIERVTHGMYRLAPPTRAAEKAAA